MPRIYKRFKPHGSTYVRKTAYKHGREVVKPIDVEDFIETNTNLLLNSISNGTEITSYSLLGLTQDAESIQYWNLHRVTSLVAGLQSLNIKPVSDSNINYLMISTKFLKSTSIHITSP